MASTDTIKEFLISLGFRTDEAALKKFERGISQATKAVITLGTALEATALAVSVGVARFASNLEQLYFASVRTGSSATNLRTFARAAQDFGASAEEAQGSIEGLARFLRSNPGGAGALGSWFGLSSAQTHGDPVQLAMAIGQAMQKMPQWQALMLGQRAGLSENTILAMLNPSFTKNFAAIADQLRKAGFGKAAADAHDFMSELRALGDQLTVFGTQIEDALQQKLGISLKGITDWLQQHGEELANKIVDVIKTVWDEAGKVLATAIPLMENLYNELVKLDSATDGWSTKLLVILGLLGATGTGSVVGGVLSLSAAFVRLTSVLIGLGSGGALSALGSLVASVGGLVTIAASAGVGLGWLFDKVFPNNWLAQFGEKLGGGIYDATQFASGEFNSAKNGKRDFAMNSLVAMGWSKNQAAGIVSNLMAESSLNSTAVNGSHYGLGQWDTNRQADFAKWAGFDMHDSRASFLKQLQFEDYELRYGKEQGAGKLLLAEQNARRAGEIVSHYYERPGLPVQDALRGANAARIASETTINVYGVTDPAAVAKLVAAEQKRVAQNNNAAVIRENSSMVQ